MNRATLQEPAAEHAITGADWPVGNGRLELALLSNLACRQQTIGREYRISG
jgi:hypothetical protein